MEADKRVRVRLVFEDGDILSRSQRKQGLERCWILLRPRLHETIRDFSSHVVGSFGLRVSCPRGILLFMDGFVLPQFESTSLLKDEDVIRVRRKRAKVADSMRLGDKDSGLREIVVIDGGQAGLGLELLANEEFEREPGSYESEEKHLESSLEEEGADKNAVSKKRKPSKEELRGSKIKKGQMANAEECLEVSGGGVDDAAFEEGNQVQENRSHLKRASCDVGDCSRRKDGSLRKPMQENSKEVSIAMTTEIKPIENEKESPSQSTEPLGSNKLPSRSARRKKAKRQWLRELRKIGKMEVNIKESPSKSVQTKKSCFNNKEDRNNQNLTKDASKQYQNHKTAEVHHPVGNENDATANVLPIVIRPGHIRFEPLGEDAEQAVRRVLPPMSFQWNGTTNKKKGQKWGKERAGISLWMKPKLIDQDSSQVPNIEEKISLNNSEDLSKLPPYTSFPKVGDIVAYRVIELSSSWCPELTCFRVGKLSSFFPKSNKVVLVPVPEHPIDMDNVDKTLYGEDGSLEINFSSLIDVRNAERGSLDSVRPFYVQSGVTPGSVGDVTACLANNKDRTPLAPADENGGANLWDEISEALSAKKVQLSLQDN